MKNEKEIDENKEDIALDEEIEQSESSEKEVKAEKKKSAKPKKKKSIANAGMVNYEKEEVERLITKLAQNSMTPSQIGMALRDQYGIPDVKVFGFTIGQALKKSKMEKEIPEDLYNLIKKAVVMSSHLERNKKDKKNVHRLQLIESRVRKLGRYYVKVGKLPKGWKYDLIHAKLIVK